MGGKRMMILTKEATKKEKKHHFTAGPALVGVGTAKFVDA